MVPFVRAIVVFHSYSGNTREVAEIINEQLTKSGISSELYEIPLGFIEPPDLRAYDIVFFGTYSWGKGRTPRVPKMFLQRLGYKPELVAVFGTGDTQFGGANQEYYCGAVTRLHKFFDSPYMPLKIEQSPRGSQEQEVIKWVREIIKDDR